MVVISQTSSTTSMVTKIFLVLAVLHLVSSVDETGQTSFMPMVAFLCRRPAVHMTEAGWKRDEEIDCLTNPKDILEYCKHVYPDLDIHYVVEASEVVRIPNWCKVGKERCSHHSHAVRPFRCLVRPFISDALLVPKNCVFDHIHEASQCKGYSDWNKTAASSCLERGMFLKSFAMIQPCDVIKFTGTEFVCCPGDHVDEGKKSSPQMVVVNRTKDHPKSSVEMNRTHKAPKLVPKLKVMDFDDKAPVKRVAQSEEAANKTMEGHNHRKHANKVLKQAGAKVKHTSMKSKNHYDTVTAQPTTLAVAVDNTNVKRVNVKENVKPATTIDKDSNNSKEKPEMEIQVHNDTEKQLKIIEEQKKLHLESYLKSLNEEPISVARVLSTLKKYVKNEQKERIQAIESYKNLREVEPAAEEAALERVTEHLKEINQALEEALQMLEKIPKHGKKMRQHMDDYIKNLPSIDDSILRRTLPSSSSSSSLPLASAATTQHLINSPSVMSTLEAAAPQTPKGIFSPSTDTSLHSASSSSLLSSSPAFSPVSAESSLMTEMQSRHEPRYEFKPLPDHMGKNQLNVEQSHIKKVPGSSGNMVYVRHHDDKMTNPVGIILTSIGLVLIVVIGIVALIKRVNSVPVSNGYLDKPAKRADSLRKTSVGVANGSARRQNSMNGYENPTYRYFEAHVTQ